MKTKKKPKTRKKIIIGLSVLAVILVVAFIARPKTANYATATAAIGDISTYYTFTGNIEAKNRQSVISSKVMQISKIYVKDGDIVAEGDDLLRTSLGEYITADIAGEVVNLNVEINKQVMSGVKLLDVVDYSAMEISVKVDEYDVSAVTSGKEATVTISATDKIINGSVNNISKEGTITNGVTYFNAVIDLVNDDTLKVGMSAEVKINHENVAGVIIIPMAAIQFDSSNNPYVLIKNAQNKIVKSDITVGINDGVNVQIISGVAEGDVVYYSKTGTATTLSIGGRVK